jgi:putative FmdB family regulatory protein
MPIYEFYCPDCHRIMNFLSKRIDTKSTPPCPVCNGGRLTRQVSAFAVGHRGEGGGEDDVMGDLPIDESRMEGAIEALASEAERLNEDDPRAAAELMRKFSSMTGLAFNEGMEEAIARMEAGEDPDAIEQEMGDLMDGDADPFVVGGKGRRKRGAPMRDTTLYEM